MTETGRSKGKQLAVAGLAAAVILVGGYFAVGALRGDPNAQKLASGDAEKVLDGLMETNPDALDGESDAVKRKAMDTLRNASPADFFDRMRSDDLTEEQRQNLRRNTGRLVREQMDRNVEEYDKASEDQKLVVLDRHIDEMVEFQKKMQDYWEKRREQEGDREGDGDGERDRGRRGWQPPSKEQREMRMASSSPEQRARHFQYFMKLMARAQERGVSMWGGGGRGRGGSGGRGGPRGGDRGSGGH